MPKIKELIAAIEEVAPLRLQESYDNTGLQVGDPDAEATGTLLCVDATASVVDEAARRGYNVIVSHHPLLFHGVKCVAGRSRPEVVLAEAIRRGITIYSSHTALDNSSQGISHRMARMLGLHDVSTLVPATPGGTEGFGAVGALARPLSPAEFLELVNSTFHCAALRYSAGYPGREICRVALCGGSAAEFLPQAIAAGAQAYVTADCKLNQFLDYADRILLVDAGHYETEQCAVDIFSEILTEKFPNFAVATSTAECNPVVGYRKSEA